MIILVQILVIVIALAIVATVLGKRSTHAVRAYKKIGLMCLAIGMIAAVMFPDSTNVVAHAVGVGRGADLLLYVTVLAFIFYALNNYLKLQDQRDTLFKLARRVAIIEAKNKNKLPK